MMRAPLLCLVASALIVLVSSLERNDALKHEMDELRKYVQVTFPCIFNFLSSKSVVASMGMKTIKVRVNKCDIFICCREWRRKLKNWT